MRLSGYQPQYFPRLHYIARALDSDIFALADNVQFVRMHTYLNEEGKRWRGPSYQAHTPIKTSQGLQHMSIHTQHDGLKPINQTRLDNNLPWAQDHSKGIHLNYARALHGKKLHEHVTQLLTRTYESVADLNTTTLLWALAWILEGPENTREYTLESLNTALQKPHPFRLKRIVSKSALGIAPSNEESDATDTIMTTCKKLGADEYCAGGTARLTYLDEKRLQSAGIKIVQQQWHPLPYRQQFPQKAFISNLSILDLLANENQTEIQRLLTTQTA